MRGISFVFVLWLWTINLSIHVFKLIFANHCYPRIPVCFLPRKIKADSSNSQFLWLHYFSKQRLTAVSNDFHIVAF